MRVVQYFSEKAVITDNILTWNHCPNWRYLAWLFPGHLVIVDTALDPPVLQSLKVEKLPPSADKVVLALSVIGLWNISWKESGTWMVINHQGHLVPITRSYYSSTHFGIYLAPPFLARGRDHPRIGHEIARLLRRIPPYHIAHLHTEDSTLIRESGNPNIIDIHPRNTEHVLSWMDRNSGIAKFVAPSTPNTPKFFTNFFYTQPKLLGQSRYPHPWSWTRLGGLLSPDGSACFHPHTPHGGWTREPLADIGAMEDFRGNLWLFQEKSLLCIPPKHPRL